MATVIFMCGPAGSGKSTIARHLEEQGFVRSTCLEWVAARRRAHGDDLQLAAKDAAAYFDHFEPPTPDEGPLSVVTS